MSTTSALSKIPVLRTLVPFALGILIHRVWHCLWMPLVLIALATFLYLWFKRRSSTPQETLRLRPFFIIPLAIASLSLGWLCAHVHDPATLTQEQRTDRLLTGRVEELSYTDFSMRMTVKLLEQGLPRSKVLVSTRGCNYNLQAGDLVSWPAELTPVDNMGNPGEMDYAAYLLNNKGVRYQQHLPVDKITKTGHSPTLLTRMAIVRRNLQLMVFNSRLEPPAQQFVVALLLGNNDFIDKATRQEFSAAGVAHVLALSGLHVGFIALIIWWMLFPLDYLRLKKLRLVITLAVIILFAVFTGLSPSVVRATVMIGFVFASLIFYRRSVSLNALCMAALIILVFSPSALYSVGFQLSFITVAALLIFTKVPDALQSKYPAINYITTTVATSVIAMLATVALSAYYFHTVSFMSVMANLLILPVLPIFMILGAVFLLVSAAEMSWGILEWSINSIYRYIHWAASSVSHIPLSHIQGVYVSAFGVIAYFVILLLIVLWLYRRSYRYLLAAACATALLLGHSLWIDARTPRRGLVIFNSFASTPVCYFDNGTCFVWTPDNEETDSADFARYHAGYFARYNINRLQFVNSDDTLRLGAAMFKPPYAYLMGQRLMAAGAGKWKRMTASSQLELDDIIITKRFHGTAAKLQELYHFDRLIVSGAMYKTSLEPLIQECDSLDIKIHQLGKDGAVEIY